MEFIFPAKSILVLISSITLILILILHDHQVSGIRCYECSSSWSQDCNMSPPPRQYLKPCAVPLCSKLYAEENGIVRVERFCGGSDFTNGCRDTSYPDRNVGGRYYRAISCGCNDADGCNSGFSIIAKRSWATLALVLIPIFKMMIF